MNRQASRGRLAAILVLAALLGACATPPARNPQAQWVPSPNHDTRRAQLIVLHYTQQHGVAESLATLRGSNRTGPVSAHYLVGADGTLYQLVAESARAWHAGGGHWGTISDVNGASIGIEIDNDGNTPFTAAQIARVIALLQDLTSRLPIPRQAVIGHEDLAPGRKIDPGPLFPWSRLAAAGFGLWPRGELRDPAPGFDPWLALAAIGYPLDDRAATVRAFHHHFRGMQSDTLDTEDLRILDNLARQLTTPPCTGTSAPAEAECRPPDSPADGLTP